MKYNIARNADIAFKANAVNNFRRSIFGRPSKTFQFAYWTIKRSLPRRGPRCSTHRSCCIVCVGWAEDRNVVNMNFMRILVLSYVLLTQCKGRVIRCEHEFYAHCCFVLTGRERLKRCEHKFHAHCYCPSTHFTGKGETLWAWISCAYLVFCWEEWKAVIMIFMPIAGVVPRPVNIVNRGVSMNFMR